jgi:hypothetical protein
LTNYIFNSLIVAVTGVRGSVARQWSPGSLGYIVRVIAGGPIKVRPCEKQGRAFQVPLVDGFNYFALSSQQQVTLDANAIAVIRHGCGFEIDCEQDFTIACIPMALKQNMASSYGENAIQVCIISFICFHAPLAPL